MFGTLLLFPSLLAQAQPYDVLITGGRVLDGSGNPAYYADLAIRDGRIAAIGRLTGVTAARRIDAKGKYVCPGFIDMHSHADRGLASPDARRRSAPNLVSQGITTVLVNPDGASPWPLASQRATYERLGIGPNAALMIGHGTVRRLVMKEDHQRSASAAEIAKMRELVKLGMEEKAFGMSAGLEYVPGIWSTTQEITELVREIAPYGGVYSVHQRSESTDPRWFRPSIDKPGQPTMLDAVEETIRIGEDTGATVIWSHAKAMGANYWGSSKAAIRLITRARNRGVDIWTDQYPYNSTGGDGSTVLIPAWALGDDAYSGARGKAKKADYATALRVTMEDTGKGAKVRGDITHEIARRGGPENVVVFEHPNKAFIGKSLDALASSRGITPVQMALELQYEGYRDRPGGARLRGFSVWEDDAEAFMAQRWNATSTDAGIALAEDGPDTHARFYGSYPRKLQRYALERNVISIEDAVRSSTSLPAQILRIRDRGLLREGMAADVVVFDPAKVRDRSTFADPHHYSEGIDDVLVNGKAVVEGGKLTAVLAGKVLSR
ncbi:MAG TPA: amidohydrolase family protein [Bryobacteraceae bacterium]|nr:amidohydrolase family protein [Bryobacteraceae bacterium]